ncbi:MAG: MAE_28990/MAE_18760 family HEPN-like nuclease [Pseudanabaenaceae cyanobacterium]|jgi:hypothetical protein
MDDFIQGFEERLQEIETYLDFLEAVDEQVQQGNPQLGENGAIITPQQQKILYSSVYLQLYNLVESTVTRCLDSISRHVVDQSLKPRDLSFELRQEWVRGIARTHIDLNYEKRLESAMNLCNHLVDTLPISDFTLEKGGGNWDDEEIYRFSQRLGLRLNISNNARQAVKQKIKNDMGTLTLIKDYRNKLAHGNLSFAECGENTTAYDLRQITNRVAVYMREVVYFFKLSIDNSEFLAPERRN